MKFAGCLLFIGLLVAAGPAAASTYRFRPLSLPPGYHLVKNIGTAPWIYGSPAALAENGNVALLATRGQNPFRSNRIIIWRPDGSRVALLLPAGQILARALRHKIADTGDDAAYPGLEFNRVVLAPDGTPYATVANEFSGAYSGTDKAVFRWTSRGWQLVAGVAEYREDAPLDFDVIAVLRAEIVMNAGYSSTFMSLDRAKDDAHYLQPEVWLRTNALTRIASMRATSAAGAFVAGFQSRHGGESHPAADLWGLDDQSLSAVVWNGGRMHQLGPGIAQAVNAAGVAVGDDGANPRFGSFPVRWANQRKVRLASAPGSARGINASGTIVGDFSAGGGFVIRDGRLQRLADPAYAVNARGQILVGTTAGLGLLTPQ